MKVWIAGWLGALPLLAALPPQGLPPEAPAVFHSGTRLVEVEVVVRDQPVREPGAVGFFKDLLDTGPPFGPPGALVKGLSKDDFTLFDNGKPQPIAVFNSRRAFDRRVDKPAVLPPGVVSSRQDQFGQPLDSATLVFLDLLNINFDLKDYARLGLKSLLGSLTTADSRLAVYTLGDSLHVLHDFDDDPQRLTVLAAQLDQPRSKLPPDVATALADFGDLSRRGDIHGQMTARAVQLMIQRLSRLPGRKNLVWLMSGGSGGHGCNSPLLPPAITTALRQANVVLYPVLVRAVLRSDPDIICTEHKVEATAATTGGRAFFDALDLSFAARAAEEESSSAYVLGYYPAEDTLDGKYHNIVVKLTNPKAHSDVAEIHYRPGYLATRVPTGGEAAKTIGLTAQLHPDPGRTSLREMRLTVDLHDLHLEPKDGGFTGAFDFTLLAPGSASGRTATAHVSIAARDLAEALANGYTVNVGGIDPESGEIRVVVRDQATGAAGELQVPIERQ